MTQSSTGDIPLIGDLQLEEDLNLERRGWVVERVGWIVLLAIVIAALAGLIGNGPLSSTSAGTADQSLSAEYDRFLHYHSQTTLELLVSEDVSDQSEIKLCLSQELLSAIDIKHITPEPTERLVGKGRHVFVFPVADPGKPTKITLHFEPDKIGKIQGEIGIEGRDELQVNSFAYP